MLCVDHVASLLFFLNRYVSLGFIVARLWLPDSQRVASNCHWVAYHTAQASMEHSPVMHDMGISQKRYKIMLATQVFIVVQYILNAAFASLRVHALTGRSRPVSILTFVLACGPVVMTQVENYFLYLHLWHSNSQWEDLQVWLNWRTSLVLVLSRDDSLYLVPIVRISCHLCLTMSDVIALGVI
ncbi:hypothetical protein C8Q74DRAFT_772503 [Fomes fomentarius]|nr:hypothetical protein C8Q74DRAFT_772503 [Fomes fomentarius]